MKSSIPGVTLCLLTALPAWYLGHRFPVIGGPVFSILLGMLLTGALPVLLKRFHPNRPGFFAPGVRFTSKVLLQASVILLGFEMNLWTVLRVGGQSLMVILFTLTAAFMTAFLIGRALKMEGGMTTLIGVGTSICGGSAIAATAPVIKARDEDISHAISTIFLFNVLAVFIFPPLGRLLHMSDTGFGMWAGTAVNDTSSVVAAATAWSALAGNNTALAFATVVKLARTLMIIPICLVLSAYMAKKGNPAEFHISKVFPWFVLGFAAAALFNTLGAVPPAAAHGLVTLGKFMICMAMTAIGYNTHLRHLLKNGGRPIALGLGCWFAVAAVSLAVQRVMHLW